MYGHSNLLYWWPVWLVSFVLAAVTYVEGKQMAIVPQGTVVRHDMPLDGDYLDLVLVELSLSGVEVDRHGVNISRCPLKSARPLAPVGHNYS